MNAMTTNDGVLVITNDEEILESAKGEDILTKLTGNPEEIEAQRHLIEQQRKDKTLGLRDDLQSLAKLADIVRYSSDKAYFAKLYVILKAKLTIENEEKLEQQAKEVEQSNDGMITSRNLVD